jgi:hypothetical protein
LADLEAITKKYTQHQKRGAFRRPRRRTGLRSQNRIS